MGNDLRWYIKMRPDTEEKLEALGVLKPCDPAHRDFRFDVSELLRVVGRADMITDEWPCTLHLQTMFGCTTDLHYIDTNIRWRSSYVAEQFPSYRETLIAVKKVHDLLLTLVDECVLLDDGCGSDFAALNDYKRQACLMRVIAARLEK